MVSGGACQETELRHLCQADRRGTTLPVDHRSGGGLQSCVVSRWAVHRFLAQAFAANSALLIIPRTGGQERVLGESDVTLATDSPVLPYLAWTPDSEWLVFPFAEPGKAGGGLFLLSVETLEKQRLTEGKDASPAFSPDGRTLVFTRWSYLRSDIYLLRLGVNYEPQGSPQRVVETGEPFAWSAAWMSDGSEIVSSCGSYTSGSLWRMAASASAKPRRLAIASEDVGPLAVSRQRNRLGVRGAEVQDEHLAC